MPLIHNRVQPGDLVNLAPLECLASAVMSGLKLAGLNHHLFVAKCWDVRLNGDILMSYREVEDYLIIDELYGTQSDLVEEGSVPHLDSLFAAGGVAYYLCFASRLFYFPRAYLSYEVTGLSHAVILTDYNKKNDSLFVMDPLVEFCGEIGATELLAASIDRGRLTYFTQRFPDRRPAPGPDPRDILIGAAKRNLSVYVQGNNRSGVHALRLFRGIVGDSLHWDEDRRGLWVDMNKVTLSSIIRMRRTVWSSLQSLGSMSADFAARGDALVEEVVQHWNAVIFWMLKYKRNFQSEEITDSIIQKIDDVERAEIRFLEHLDSFR